MSVSRGTTAAGTGGGAVMMGTTAAEIGAGDEMAARYRERDCVGMPSRGEGRVRPVAGTKIPAAGIPAAL